eukprot:759250-Hanusia_phi.AAC.4
MGQNRTGRQHKGYRCQVRIVGWEGCRPLLSGVPCRAPREEQDLERAQEEGGAEERSYCSAGTGVRGSLFSSIDHGEPYAGELPGSKRGEDSNEAREGERRRRRGRRSSKRYQRQRSAAKRLAEGVGANPDDERISHKTSTALDGANAREYAMVGVGRRPNMAGGASCSVAEDVPPDLPCRRSKGKIGCRPILTRRRSPTRRVAFANVQYNELSLEDGFEQFDLDNDGRIHLEDWMSVIDSINMDLSNEASHAVAFLMTHLRGCLTEGALVVPVLGLRWRWLHRSSGTDFVKDFRS